MRNTRSNVCLRVFFYFRTGYANYFALIVGVVNILTSSYFLAIEKVSELLIIFPTFEIYISMVILIGVPTVILAGWIHMKKIGTYSAEQNIYNETQPFNYKAAPGYVKETVIPIHHEIVKMWIKKIENGKLDENDKNRIDKLEKDVIKLINGGYVGNPPSGAS